MSKLMNISTFLCSFKQSSAAGSVLSTFEESVQVVTVSKTDVALTFPEPAMRRGVWPSEWNGGGQDTLWKETGIPAPPGRAGDRSTLQGGEGAGKEQRSGAAS